MTKNWNVDCGAWAEEQVPVVPGTEEIIWENLSEGHIWMIGATLLNTDGVGLLNFVCIVFDPHLPSEDKNCTCDKRTRG